MELTELIQKTRERLAAGRFANEQSVREALVVPLLQALGWDVIDPDTVVREYGLSGRRVDYALFSGNGGAGAFIEVKSPGQLIDADRQLFEYAFHEGVPFAILTDGNEWHFFLPGEQGAYSERRVYKLDLSERETGHAADILRRYLEFERFRSGQALDDARSDYRDKARKREAELALPKAWREIVQGRDEILIDLLAEKAESLCGVRPEAEQVEAFIASFLVAAESSGWSRATSETGKTRPTKTNTLSKPDEVHRPSKTDTDDRLREKSDSSSMSSRKIEYYLLGQKYKANTAKQALLDILQKLAKDDPRFFEKLAPRVRTRKRNHIATTKDDVYPDRPDLAGSATEIFPGWWIGLNIANREKRRILERACEVAGIRYGDDLKIDLPHG